MTAQKRQPSLLNLSRLTWSEVEKEIRRSPALIVPLGGLEPYGRAGTLGIASVCGEALANALSEKTQLLCAPVLNYGCSTPWQSFGGAAGVKPRTLTNILCETVRGWFFQGFKTIMVIDALTENSEALELAVRRLKTSHPGLTVTLFSIQKDPLVLAFTAKQFSGQELGRTEYGMLSMAAWIDPELMREAEKENTPGILPNAERFRQWHKRGADPEQFRKLFPDGSSSAIGSRRYGADFGKQLFGYILQLLEAKVESIFKTVATNRNLHASS